MDPTELSARERLALQLAARWSPVCEGFWMAFTLAQVSDPHLCAEHTLFCASFDRAVQAVEDVRPDLVIASGDLSRDGADSEADLAFAAQQFARMPAPVHAIPGNHDVGDHPDPAPLQPVTDERLDRYCRHMGRDRWVVDVENWRLLGLNSQVMGAHPAEAAQARMIEAALETLGERRLAVFIHKPFFSVDMAETRFDYWSVPPFARAAIRPVMEHPNLRLVGSGHLHLYREMRCGPVRFIWCPSVAFTVAAEKQPELPGDRRCGIMVYRFDADGVESTMMEWPGVERRAVPKAEVSDI